MINNKKSIDSKILISVIVPLYNAEAHVENCLLSIQTQSFKYWECICVDDGSTDEGPGIVKNFLRKDPRFRLIQQKNAGPGAARNTGLETIQGEYFTFVDADDLVHPEMLQRIFELSQSYDADLVVCDYFHFKSDDEFYATIRKLEFVEASPDLEKALLLPKTADWKKFRVHPVGKLYLRHLYGNLRFPNEYGAEDDYVSLDVYNRSKRAVFYPICLYGYRVVPEGLSQSVIKYRNYISGDARVAVHCEEVCREKGLSSELTAQLVLPHVMRIFGLLNSMVYDRRINAKEKKSLVGLARRGLLDIKCCVGGKFRIVPSVHLVPYGAVRLNSLWLLKLWQLVRKVKGVFV